MADEVIGKVKQKLTEVTPLAWVSRAAEGEAKCYQKESGEQYTGLKGHVCSVVESSVGRLKVNLGEQDGLLGVVGTEGDENVKEASESVTEATGGEGFKLEAVVDRAPGTGDDVKRLVMRQALLRDNLATFVDRLLMSETEGSDDDAG